MAEFCFTIPPPAKSRQNPRGTRVEKCLSYNAAIVLLLFKKYIFFFHRGMKFKTRQTCFCNAVNGWETCPWWKPGKMLWLVPPRRVLASLCEAWAVCGLSQDNHLVRNHFCWLLRLILRCLTSGTAFYSLCEYMSHEHSSVGWQERQIRHQRMRNAEILAWLCGCTPAVELHFYSHYRVRSTQECFQVCSSWKQGVKLFQKPEGIDFSQRISS